MRGHRSSAEPPSQVIRALIPLSPSLASMAYKLCGSTFERYTGGIDQSGEEYMGWPGRDRGNAWARQLGRTLPPKYSVD